MRRGEDVRVYIELETDGVKECQECVEWEERKECHVCKECVLFLNSKRVITIVSVINLVLLCQMKAFPCFFSRVENQTNYSASSSFPPCSLHIHPLCFQFDIASVHLG